MIGQKHRESVRVLRGFIDMAPKLPFFLVIGAQKCGTTSLCDDLSHNPNVSFGRDKEPHFLVPQLYDSSGLSDHYERLYRGTAHGQVLGDGSTGYSRVPTFRGVPKRALTLMGSELRIIYIVRHPIDRILSHYFHERAIGRVREPLNEAVGKYSRFVDYSSYAMQVHQWLELFPARNLLILKFEDYVSDRTRTYESICAFLGVPDLGLRVDPDRVLNRTGDTPKYSGVASWLQHTRVYRKLRMLLPPRGQQFVADIARLCFGRMSVRDESLEPDIRQYLKYRLAADMREFQKAAPFSVDDWV